MIGVFYISFLISTLFYFGIALFCVSKVVKLTKTKWQRIFNYSAIFLTSFGYFLFIDSYVLNDFLFFNLGIDTDVIQDIVAISFYSFIAVCIVLALVHPLVIKSTSGSLDKKSLSVWFVTLAIAMFVVSSLAHAITGLLYV